MGKKRKGARASSPSGGASSSSSSMRSLQVAAAVLVLLVAVAFASWRASSSRAPGRKNSPRLTPLETWGRDVMGVATPFEVSMGEDAAGLRGMFAREDIPAGAPLITVPWNSTLNPTTLDAEGFRCFTLNTKMCMTLYVLRERARGDESRWAPYLRSWPLVHEWTTALYSERMRSFVARYLPQMRAVSTLRSEELRKEYEEIKEYMPEVSFPRFLWARENIHSRTFQVSEIPHGPSTLGTVMVPLADLFNHHVYVNANRKDSLFHPATWEYAVGRFQLLTQRAWSKGEQVFISYGFKHLAGFMTSYGFLPEVPFQFVGASIPMSVEVGDPLRAQKLELLKKCYKVPAFATIRATFLPYATLGHALIVLTEDAALLDKPLCRAASQNVSPELTKRAYAYIKTALVKQKRLQEEPLPFEPTHQTERFLVRMRELEHKVVTQALRMFEGGRLPTLSNKDYGQA